DLVDVAAVQRQGPGVNLPRQKRPGRAPQPAPRARQEPATLPVALLVPGRDQLLTGAALTVVGPAPGSAVPVLAADVVHHRGGVVHVVDALGTRRRSLLQALHARQKARVARRHAHVLAAQQADGRHLHRLATARRVGVTALVGALARVEELLGL